MHTDPVGVVHFSPRLKRLGTIKKVFPGQGFFHCWIYLQFRCHFFLWMFKFLFVYDITFQMFCMPKIALFTLFENNSKESLNLGICIYLYM